MGAIVPTKSTSPMLMEAPPELSIDIDRSMLRWPRGAEAREALALNNVYGDFSGMDWSDAEDIVAMECAYLAPILRADSTRVEALELFERLQDELIDDDCVPPFDIGVWSCVAVLNAAGCPSWYSCNGHGRDAAFVRFWLRKRSLDQIEKAARIAEVGLVNLDAGDIEVHAVDAFGLIRFAHAIRELTFTTMRHR